MNSFQRSKIVGGCEDKSYSCSYLDLQSLYYVDVSASRIAQWNLTCVSGQGPYGRGQPLWHKAFHACRTFRSLGWRISCNLYVTVLAEIFSLWAISGMVSSS